jgi:hypothetical protein
MNVELFCGKRIWIYEFVVCSIIGCLFDYHCCCFVIFVPEGSIPLDSDTWNLDMSWRPWFTRSFRFNHVEPLSGKMLIGSGKDYGAIDAVKGDLFVILGACFYGLSNVLEEYLVSKRPLYEVVGQVHCLFSIR